jgi:hypothetical protein
MRGYYYLHTETKDLIFKPEIVVQHDKSYFNSPFVEKVWQVDTSYRTDAWGMVLEALGLGASVDRVKELADKWGMDLEDAVMAITRIQPTDLRKKGLDIFLKEILNVDPQEFWAGIKKGVDKNGESMG